MYTPLLILFNNESTDKRKDEKEEKISYTSVTSQFFDSL
jgi:hypothetical protein